MGQKDTSQVIGCIYDAAKAGADWGPALNEIANLARAETAWMVLSMPRLDFNAVVAPRSDPEIIADYQRHWWQKDPTLETTKPTPVGMITSLDFTGRDRFLSSEFHNEFWRRSGHSAERLAANLICEEGAGASIGIQPARRHDDTTTKVPILPKPLLYWFRM
ncbi:hypothetical protein [Ruegeria hyattellae]|uniref:hypothetical protein n=1 Tax=Ruegeria hyattellae TaxID=3233337 RepID=UPI00355C6565